MPQLPGVRHRFVNAGDLKTHVAVGGEGSPVVLLHGWPEHWYMWRGVMPPLTERHRVLAPDLRGFGWTDIAWTGFEKENMAGDVVRLLDAMEIDRAQVVGHDWGGWIGAIMALRHPDRVERLVALNTPLPFVGPAPRHRPAVRHLGHMLTLSAPYAAQRLLQKHPGYVRRVIRTGAHDKSGFDKEVFRIYTRDLKSPTRARASALLYRTFLLREMLPLATRRYRKLRLTTPTLLMTGKHDPAVPPRLVEGYERYADDLTVEVVPDAGHFLPEERPELVADRILDFLQARSGAPAEGSTASIR